MEGIYSVQGFPGKASSCGRRRTSINGSPERLDSRPAIVLNLCIRPSRGGLRHFSSVSSVPDHHPRPDKSIFIRGLQAQPLPALGFKGVTRVESITLRAVSDCLLLHTRNIRSSLVYYHIIGSPWFSSLIYSFHSSSPLHPSQSQSHMAKTRSSRQYQLHPEVFFAAYPSSSGFFVRAMVTAIRARIRR